jgi:hypothetical protein
MALILSNIETPITVSGTTIELPEVYNRLEFGCRSNGITMEIAFSTYENSAMYQSGSMVQTNVPITNYTADIDPLTQVQSVESAHELAKTYYEGLGYTVVIDLA